MTSRRSQLSSMPALVVAVVVVSSGLEMSAPQASAAGRYHMRVRTERFFNRAAPLSTKARTSGLPSFDQTSQRPCPQGSAIGPAVDHRSK